MNLTKKQYKGWRFLQDATQGIMFVLYGGAAGGGKSWLGCYWLLFMCSHFPGVRYFIGRNNMKDSRESVLVTFDKVCRMEGYTDCKSNNEGIIFGNGSTITLLDLSYYPLKDPMFQRLGSKEFTGGFIEEAGEVYALAFDVLKSRVGRHLNDVYGIPPKIFISCNPQKNWLFNTFYKPWRDKTLRPPYAFIKAMHQDNEYLTKEYLEALNAIEDKVTKQRLLHGIWEYENDESQLCDYDAINDMFTNDFVAQGDPALSCDIALKGRDRYIAGYWRGLTVRVVSDMPYIKANKLEEDVRQNMIRYSIPRSKIVVDSDGNGSYLADYIPGIVEFHGGSSAYDAKKYANLKSECGFKLAYVVNKRLIHVICTEEQRRRIMEEMEVLRQDKIDQDTKKLSLISKDEMKRLLGRSPDTLDMLIMGMLHYVRPRYGTGKSTVMHLPNEQ